MPNKSEPKVVRYEWYIVVLEREKEDMRVSCERKVEKERVVRERKRETTR